MLETILAIIFIFHFFNFLLFARLQAPTSVGGRYKSVREASEMQCEAITFWTDKSLEKGIKVSESK